MKILHKDYFISLELLFTFAQGCSYESEVNCFLKLVVTVVVVVVLLFYVHGKHLRSCRNGQFT